MTVVRTDRLITDITIGPVMISFKYGDNCTFSDYSLCETFILLDFFGHLKTQKLKK